MTVEEKCIIVLFTRFRWISNAKCVESQRRVSISEHLLARAARWGSILHHKKTHSKTSLSKKKKKNHLIIFLKTLSLIFDNRKTSCTKTISACEKHQDKYPLETKRYAWMLKDFFVSKYTEFERRKKCYQNNVMKWRIGMTWISGHWTA